MINIIAFTFIGLIFIFIVIGRSIDNNAIFSFTDIFVGFSFLMGFFFVITHFSVNKQVSSLEYHQYIYWSVIFTLIFSLIRFRFFKFNPFILIPVIVYLAFMIFLSSRYTLGEQMGDNIYLFNIVNGNINISVLNNFDLTIGQEGLGLSLGLTKAYVSFYMFFSSLYYYVSQWTVGWSKEYLPPYVLNMWVSNLIFYFFSIGFILDILNRVKTKKILVWLILIVWLGIYTGSIYYNITLPHIVVTYLVIFASYIYLLVYDYFQTFDRKILIKIVILMFGMNGFGGTGALFVMVFAFGIVATSAILKKRDVFIQIPLMLIPVVEYANIMVEHEAIFKYSILAYIFITLICVALYFFEYVSNWILKLAPVLLVLLLLMLLYYSSNSIDDYWAKVSSFSLPQFGADRTQDYFSFTNIELIIRNVFYYLLVILMLFNAKMRYVGVMLLIILLFFVNPLMKPLVAERIARYDVYNRIFFTVFNSGSIGLGLYALYDFLKAKVRKFHKIILIGLVLFMSIPTYTQATSYFYPSYEPQEDDFNPIYKMGDQQVEVLEYLRTFIKEEEVKEPRVISQIFGTAMYTPEFITLGYNVNQQRNGNYIIGETLYQMFYTPAIPGDERPEITINLRQSCKHLWEYYVDFAIYDKSFSVFDQEIGNYVPVYWYMNYCGAVLLFENNRYILFQVPRDLLNR